MATIGLPLSLFWLVADGLDGMIARATGTPSAAGRVLDGLCDHGVFLCRTEEHTSELQSLMRISSPVFCLKKQNHLPHASLSIDLTNTHIPHHRYHLTRMP